ncbi:hypothetical protein AB0F30_27475 [Streptomyces sp. NPDC029006]|uniref:YncE family protein n=1 Tax=Streptomyces sp. NPDC029006 TaxID=3155467 RepID=UPI0033F78DB2
MAATPDGRRLYVTSADGTGAVFVVDTGNHSISAKIVACPGARGVAMAPACDRAYVISDAQDQVRVIDTATASLTGEAEGVDADVSIATCDLLARVDALASGVRPAQLPPCRQVGPSALTYHSTSCGSRSPGPCKSCH